MERNACPISNSRDEGMDVTMKFSTTNKVDASVFLVYSSLHQIKSSLLYGSSLAHCVETGGIILQPITSLQGSHKPPFSSGNISLTV
jgi:hypothetical protein